MALWGVIIASIVNIFFSRTGFLLDPFLRGRGRFYWTDGL